MISDLRAGRRVVYVIAALLVAVVGVAPLLHPSSVLADQMSNRSIKMSDSAPSGTSITTGVGSGTGVTYEVSFGTGLESGGNAESMVIDFCEEDPIINDTCTAPTGMDASSATISAVTGGGTISNWTITPSASQIKLASDGNPSNDAAPSTQETFDLNGITNPSTTGSFYARMYTYTGTTFGTYSSATSVGTYTDYGGIALSTAQVITITARVQEQLSFCLSGADPSTWGATPGDSPNTPDCNAPEASTAPALVLGGGSPTPVLDPQHIYTGDVYSQLSTNATSGAVIDMRDSNTSCGGLSADSGTTCNIPPIGATATQMVAGTADFGMTVTASADGTDGTGTVVATAPYNSSTTNYYGMDNTAGTGVTSTFGSEVASASAPCYRVNNTYTFAATDSLTTPAGIYTADMDMIATGKF